MKRLISIILALTINLFLNVHAAEEDHHEISLTGALQKFSTELENLKSTLDNNSPDKHPTINMIFNFYTSMVLMHVTHQNYVQSYLDGRVCWYHVIGLALAFETCRTHTTISDGFFSQNNQFLTQVLKLYRKM